jgi:hypothetical protein
MRNATPGPIPDVALTKKLSTNNHYYAGQSLVVSLFRVNAQGKRLMPEFELPQLAACCGQPIVIEYRDGNIYPHCGCTRISIENWGSDHNGPSLSSVCDHSLQRRVRLSGRIVQGGSGLTFREIFKTERGRIFESRGSAFLVSLDSEGGRQVWLDSFESAYCLLTGSPWSANNPAERITSEQLPTTNITNYEMQ